MFYGADVKALFLFALITLSPVTNAPSFAQQRCEPNQCSAICAERCADAYALQRRAERQAQTCDKIRELQAGQLTACRAQTGTLSGSDKTQVERLVEQIDESWTRIDAALSTLESLGTDRQ